jgi:phosphoglycerol transferase MdoB-like AlkP superfamily enzyme
MLWVFGICNAIFILLNIIDVAYFPFIKKRSTADLFKQVGGQTDLSTLLPQYLKEYWLLLIIYFVLIFLTIKAYKKIKPNVVQYSYDLKSISILSLSFLISATLVIIGIRGGVQRIPLDVVDAARYANPKYISLLVNSPFTIIKSLEKEELKEIEFDFGNRQINNLYDPIQHFDNDTTLKDNVVIIILESFSKEYTKLGNSKSYTPFFDSIMDHSLVFTNAFSNGHKSIEGIPAILSSMPSFMENPFINSAYADNQYNSLAGLLKKEGYSTAFFHGGTNGTMNFDSYAIQAGYDNYYGRKEYNNDEDFDGFWGIWDEPFFKYSIDKMNQMKEPFHSTIFTLSSHHPYVIPSQYKNKFPKGHLENHESVGYGDYALRTFFEHAKKQKWYKNTLFVLLADHCSISNHPFFSNNVGQFSIPVMFYKPDNSLTGKYDAVFQQSDVMPSILDHIGYSNAAFCFGNSYRKTNNRYALYFANSSHYLVNDSLAFVFFDFKLNSVFNYKSDSLLKYNLLSKANYNSEELYFKAYIQTYNNSIINNSCRIK